MQLMPVLRQVSWHSTGAWDQPWQLELFLSCVNFRMLEQAIHLRTGDHHSPKA